MVHACAPGALIAAAFILLSIIPSGLNLFGVDFSADAVYSTGVAFITSGSALVAALVSFLRYRIHRDKTTCVVGLVLLASGLIHLFPVLAESRVTDVTVQRSVIVSAWTLARTSSDLVFLIGIGIILWLENGTLMSPGQMTSNTIFRPNTMIFSVSTITLFAGLTVLSLYFSVYGSEWYRVIVAQAISATSVTMLLLLLYILMGATLWAWFAKNRSIFRLMLLLSVAPMVVAQLHKIFAANDRLDNHFNIALGLESLAYFIICLGMIAELLNKKSAAPSTMASSIAFSKYGENHTEGIDAVLEVGSAKQPLLIRLPATAFFMALSIACIVSLSFYRESENIVITQEMRELSIESRLVEPPLAQLYQEASRSVMFLSRTPSLPRLVNAYHQNNVNEQSRELSNLENIFSELLISSLNYNDIALITAEGGQEIMKVVRNSQGVYKISHSRLQQKEDQNFFTSTRQLGPGELYFSQAELLREHDDLVKPHQLIMRAATPVFNSYNDQLFGVVVLSINFGLFIDNLVNNELRGLRFFLANEFGDFLYHPDIDVRDGFNLGKRHLMQDYFPDLNSFMEQNINQKSFTSFGGHADHLHASYYSHIDLRAYGSTHSLRVVLQRDDDAGIAKLQELRNSSLLLGISMSLVALAIAVIASRRVVQPLKEMTEAVKKYEATGENQEFPTQSLDEVGVLARSFHNLLGKMNLALAAQRQSATEAKEFSERLSAIVNSAADAIITIDVNGKIISFNKAAESTFGYFEAEIIGRQVTLLMPEDHAKKHASYISNYLRTGVSGILGKGRELTGKKCNGEIFEMHLSISEADTKDGKLFTGIVRDISKEKANQRRLAEARKYIDGITNSVPVLLSYIDKELRYKFVNKNYEHWFNISVHNIIGSSIKEILGEAEYQQVYPQIEKAMSGETASFQLKMPHSDGSYRHVHTTFTPDIDDNQKIQGFFVSFEDITDAKTSEERLRELTSRLEVALSGPGIGVWEFNLKTNELVWDRRMYQLYGIREEDFSGAYEAWESGVHPDDIDTARNILNGSIDSGKDFIANFRVVRPDGDIRYVEAHAKILADESGEFERMIGINVDVTDNKTLEQEREIAMEKANESAKLKSEFLARMSHEIRTPMNGVLGMLGLLKRSELNKTQRRQVDIARSSAESLLTIVNDILDFSKVEADKLEMEELDFDLCSQLGDFAESMAQRAQDKGLELVLDLTQVKHTMVRGDPGRLRQILNNLVGNAIKFTQQGEIVIRASLNDEEGELHFRCSVQDSGIGMAAEKLDMIFESFSQVEASTTRKYGGTGLGLAIAKKLCQLMGGDIEVASEVAKGSCFTFNIQLQKSQKSLQKPPELDIIGMPILVVDDNNTNRMVLRTQLELWGAKVTDAKNADEALQKIENRFKNLNPPVFKMVFLDMQMPEKGGIELGNAIRANTCYDAIRLILMTPMSTRRDTRFLAESGFDAYFPKPATIEDLWEALTVIGDKVTNCTAPKVTRHFVKTLKQELGTSEVQMTHSNVSWPENIRLLLVEDNQINQEVALGLLEDIELDCDVAGNGIEALAVLRQAPEDSPYHLILMDCQMPDMDGYEASRQIRKGAAGNRYKEIPIIAMTANTMKGDRETCLAAGMSDYISKPVDPEDLEWKLKDWLFRENIFEPDCKANETLVTDKVWDMRSALHRVRGKEERLIRLINMFLKDMPDQLHDLQAAIENNALNDVNSIAHAIKGIAGNLSGTQFMEVAGETERLSQQGESELLKNIWPQVRSQYIALESKLHTYLKQKSA